MAWMGEDWWPYGVAPNRHTLETLARYHHEQRLSRRQMGIEGMFAPETLTD
jgi:4,5-dihydroxyphthalate decarboxylase